ncbi:unnamed protein product [Urochloa humidicola]
MELPENKLTDLIESSEKAKWRPVNNHNVKNFTEDDIKRFTKSYSTVIGEGGFGQVYKGDLDDGTPVAVKRLKQYMRQNLTEGFGKEIIVHCQINHRNVVRLLGYCMEENAFIIVTEYVSGGNLHDLLHGSDNPISLDERLRIAIECADALGYMHSSMYQPIVHGDIKPDNILLDSKLGAKLSDFGLSRLLSMDKTQYTMNVLGSRGYMDPKYIETGLVDPKSDVYSFGVVLLELITRAKASESGFSTHLKRNFTDALSEGKQEARKMFDLEISKEGNIDILDEIGNLAAECFKREIKERPEMKDVYERLQMLRKALHCDQAQEKRGQKVNKHGASISSSSSSSSSMSSSVTYKLSILDIFNKNARRYERNAGPMLEKTCKNLTIFTKRGIKEITNNYQRVIGGDIFGCAYDGHIEGHRVVVKTSIFEYQTYDTNDFATAMQTASTILHKNIIRLVGCCLETEVPQLVYEFASRGSLHDVLHGSCHLPLELRLDIAIGSAEALAYVHSVRPTKIVHGDFKPRNILLDDNFVPKVSDIFPGILSYIAHGNVAADMAYVDPVYYKTWRFTSKSDVYPFGILLLELITRKQAKYVDDYTFSLPFKYVEVWKKENSGKAMFDKEIAVEGNIAMLEEMGKLAVECLKEDLDERPEMVKVAERLQNLRRDWKSGIDGCGSSHGEEETTGSGH